MSKFVVFYARFLRELKDLKVTANYTSCDPSKLADWLLELGPDFSQYTYQLLHSGVEKAVLPSLTDDLLNDCSIVNGIHRMLILQKINGESFILYNVQLYILSGKIFCLFCFIGVHSATMSIFPQMIVHSCLVRIQMT